MLDLACLLGVLALFGVLALAAKGIERVGAPPARGSARPTTADRATSGSGR